MDLVFESLLLTRGRNTKRIAEYPLSPDKDFSMSQPHPPEGFPDVDWFDAGSAIFDGIIDDPALYPPLNDMQAQRAWLAGFGAGWIELPEWSWLGSSPDPREGDIGEVLTRTLLHRPKLLRQLLAHREGLKSWYEH